MTRENIDKLFGPIENLKTTTTSYHDSYEFASPNFIHHTSTHFSIYDLNFVSDSNNVLFLAKKKRSNRENSGSFNASFQTRLIYSYSRFNIDNEFAKLLLKNDYFISFDTIGLSSTLSTKTLVLRNQQNVIAKDYILGITKAEMDNLFALIAAHNLKRTYIYFQLDIQNTDNDAQLDANNANLYQKYKLGVAGFDTSLAEIIKYPSADIFVYASRGSNAYTSKDFTGITIQTGVYTRNYEEKMGTSGVEDERISTITLLKNKVDEYVTDLNALADNAQFYDSASALIQTKGKQVFDIAVTEMKNQMSATDPKPDDRPLYWARIKMAVKLKEKLRTFGYDLNCELAKSLIKTLEIYTRNYLGVNFAGVGAGVKKILVTGFDPFGLVSNIYQSNPSGAAALYLHNHEIKNSSNVVIGKIQVMLIPVRYTDFDGFDGNDTSTERSGYGIVENYIAPLIGGGSGRADMIITISQSGFGNFNIDRFATRNRYGSPDNMNWKRKFETFSVPLDYSELNFNYIETTLPKAMVMNGGANQAPNNQNHFVVYAQHYKYRDNDTTPVIPESLYEMEWDGDLDNLKPKNKAAVLTNIKKTPTPVGSSDIIVAEGSGGDYLSNEIFYRVALARERWKARNPSKPTFPSGHFHVANIQSSWDNLTNSYRENPKLENNYIFSSRTIYDEMKKLLLTVRSSLELGVLNINDLF